MARRYSRDNRGRFASGGSSSGGGGKVGATARGGRLRTAPGNKRATQTTKAAAAKPSGTVAGKVKRNPAAAGKIGVAKPAKQKANKSAVKTPLQKSKNKRQRVDLMSQDRMGSIPLGTIGKTKKEREIARIDMPAEKWKNYVAGRKAQEKIISNRKRTELAQKPKFRPGKLMNANAFPVSAISKPKKIKHGYGTDKKANIQNAIKQAQKSMPDLPIETKSRSRSGNIASVSMNLQTGARRMTINTAHPFWKNPAKDQLDSRRQGLFASANPKSIIGHEIGHAKHRTLGKQQYFDANSLKMARRVSKYATTNVNEFVAEVKGARSVGKRLDYQVMRAYRAAAGLPAKPKPKFRPTKPKQPKKK